MKKYGIWVYESINGPVNGWLKSYDPNFCPRGKEWFWQRGLADFTQDPAEAMAFDTPKDAFDTYMTVAESFPTRPDGHPNRPLTAYTIEVLELGQEPVLHSL